MTASNRPDPPARGDLPPDETQQFAIAARSNCGTGFSMLYERLAPALHAWAALRIHPTHRGRLDPEDVVQEVWWRAIGAFPSFDPEKGTFRAWIFQIANRVLLNGFRSLYVRGQLADPTRPRQVSMPDHLVAEATSVSEKAARNEGARRLLEQVERLEPEDRAMFTHCALEGMSAGRAAGLLGISEAAAAKRWQRLRQRLRAELGDAIFDP